MSRPAQPPAPHESWSAAEWQARAEHAAAYLATDPGWIVGPAVVRMYQRGAERARESEALAAAEHSALPA